MKNLEKDKNPRPWKKDTRKCNGLLRSISVPNSNSMTKHVLVNWDINAAINIRR